MKFLHVSDVHLGCTRYNLDESPRDFFEAFNDVVDRYAIAEKVDFVLICGDFFHKRNIEPQAMNHAVFTLRKLKDAGISVVAIEGNHDQAISTSKFSWLRSLADWELLILLETNLFEQDENGNNYFICNQWTPRKGGEFIDIGDARIFGSRWYGASANAAIPMLTRGIARNRRENAFHIVMLHTDVEGHQTHPMPALTLSSLRELRAVTDYVGVGHTHKRFEIENWVFNPGCLEVTNIDEYREEHGAYLVEVKRLEDGTFSTDARHITDFAHRPFKRVSYDVSGAQNAAQISSEVLEKIKNEVTPHDKSTKKPAPIIEIVLRGHLGFKNSLLELDKITAEVKEWTNALHVRVKNHSAPVEYAVAATLDPEAPRDERERRVVRDLIASDNRYRTAAAEMAEIVVQTKHMALSDEEPEKIYNYLNVKMDENRLFSENGGEIRTAEQIV